MKKEGLCILYTGGKDSHLALCRALVFRKFYDVKVIASVIPEDEFSYMFHKPKEEILVKHSEVMNIPIEIEYSSGEKEEELRDLKNLLRRVKRKYGVDCVVSGAIQSTYQSERINKIARDLGLKVYSPLWLNGDKLIEDYKLFRIDAVFYKVSAYPLGGNLLGKSYLKCINLLKKHNVNVFGEGGEFETLVLSSNAMRKRICIERFKKIKLGEFCFSMVIEKFSVKKNEFGEISYKVELGGRDDFLIVDLNENPLGFFEFTYPLWRMFKGKVIPASVFFKRLEENPNEVNKHKMIVLSGVPLMDLTYERFLKKASLLGEVKTKIVGVGAGAQILAKFLGMEFVRKPTVGMKDISFRGENVRTYFLTNYLFKESNSVEVLGKYKEFVVAFKKDNFLGFAFHPEYNFLTFGHAMMNVFN